MSESKYTARMRDIHGNWVEAEVGDWVAAHEYLTKSVWVRPIESIKKQFSLCGFKITPKAKQCVFIRKGTNRGLKDE